MKKPTLLEVDEQAFLLVSARLEQGELHEADYPMLKAAIETLLYLRRLLERKDTAMRRVLRMVFGASTEKTREIFGADEKPECGKRARGKKKKRKGHGRRAAAEYWGADNVQVQHDQLRVGQSCPDCDGGKLYDTNRPGTLIRLYAQPPVAGMVVEVQKLRCALCNQLFSASPPPEAGTEKYDPNVGPMIAILRYGYGLPMNRLEQMQEDFGVPLPAGTQWELVDAHARELAPLGEELIRQAAGADLFHNDDTTVKILSVDQQIRNGEAEPLGGEKPRTGIFTTGIVAIKADRKIALFFSGREHAGENLQKVLDERRGDLAVPIQMSDGLNRNPPKTTETIQANCNAHGRRGFVDLAATFPEPCRYVLEKLKQVYEHDEQARNESLDDEQRLLFHQQHSAEPMEQLKQWMEQKIEGKEVEPNSGLGEAINYMLKRWERLTRFLWVPGAPLDNNICERVLKTAIRHRKNSLFYRTENGAQVGDLFMSLIHTCRLCRVNPFDYLTQLRRFADQLGKDPCRWMPWNYQATLATMPEG